MLLTFDAIEGLTIEQACAAVVEAPKRRLEDLKVRDLILQQDGTALPGLHGVYFFFSPDNICLYVGKNSSMQFVERIPWHLALGGEETWMNHLLKYYRRHHDELATDVETALALMDCSLLLMPTPYELINRTERFFRVFLHPQFNTLVTRLHLIDEIPADANLGETIRNQICYCELSEPLG